MKPLRPSIFDDAMPAGPGRRTPQTLLLIDERARYLVEAARFYPGVSDREVARRLRRSLVLYQQGRWRRSRSDLTCAHPVGHLDAVLWCLLNIRDAIPSERLIRLAISRASRDY